MRCLLIIFARDSSYSLHHFVPYNVVSDSQPHGKALSKKDRQRVDAAATALEDKMAAIDRKIAFRDLLVSARINSSQYLTGRTTQGFSPIRLGYIKKRNPRD